MGVLSLEQFWQSQARRLLAYPSDDEATLAHRWSELKGLGLESIYSDGPQTLAGLGILGLGYCGIVLRVRHQGQNRVLKICRNSASQTSLHREATMLMRANAVAVGPQYINHSDNFLLMDYIDGPTLVDWLQRAPSAEIVYGLVRSLIHQAYRLDQTGLDHGDLRCITSHALLQSLEPVLIDFSKASLDRRPANVTTLVQGLFISTRLTQLLQPWFPQVNKSNLIRHLRRYKFQPSLTNVNQLLNYLALCKLDVVLKTSKNSIDIY